MNARFRSILFAAALLVPTLALTVPAAAQSYCPYPQVPTLCFGEGAPTVAVTATDADSKEPPAGGTGTFTITRSGGLPGSSTTVQYRLSGSAEHTADYTTMPASTKSTANTATDRGTGSVTMEGQATSATVTITPVPDGTIEGSEDVKLTILPDGDYTIGTPSEATVTITDTAPVSVSIAPVEGDATMAEDSGAAAGSTARVRVTRTGGDHTVPLTVTLSASSSSATTSDYSPVVTSITIPAPQPSADLTLTAFNDHEVEGDETLIITVVEGQNGNNYAIGTPSATLTIFDDEVPAVDITPQNAPLSESSSAPTTVTVTRKNLGGTAISPNVPLDVTVSFPGSATLTSDYTRSPALTQVGDQGNFRLTIASGQASAAITFTRVIDDLREGTEFVNVTLVASTDDKYQMPFNRIGQVAIHDADVPLITVTHDRAADGSDTTGTATSNEGPVSESATADKRTVDFTFARTTSETAALNGELAINVTVSGVDSTFNADYTLQGTTSNSTAGGVTTVVVTFAANQLTKTVGFTLRDDAIPEGVETVVLQVKTAPGPNVRWGVGTPSRASLTINGDNDAGTPVPPGGTAPADADGDAVPDATDNCVNVANGPGHTGSDGAQKDVDGDKVGDACDTDDDNDSLLDSEEGPSSAAKTDSKIRDTDADGRADGQEFKTDKTDPLDKYSPEFRASDIAVSSDGKGVHIGWKAPTGSLANRYLVFRNSTATLIGSVAGDGKTAYNFTDPSYDGEAHTYHVQAMLPSMTGDAYDAKASGPASASFQQAICEAYTKDTDNDGLCDQEESVTHKTDPTNGDSDGDSFSDKAELDVESDPNDATITPKTVAGAETSWTRETPFWLGLILMVATLVALVVGIGMARREPALPYQDQSPPL